MEMGNSMRYLLIFVFMVLFLYGCTTPIKACRSFCNGERSQLFKDEDLECRCVQ